MPVLNTEALISGFVNTVFADAMLTARENSIMPALVTVMSDINGLAARTNAKYSGVTINLIGETDDMTSQAFTPSTDQTLTPVEYGAQFFFTDSRTESDIYAVRQDAALELGQALGTKIDTLLVGKFNALTAGTAGTVGAANINWNRIFQAETLLQAAFAPRPYVCVLSPWQWFCLGTAVAPGAAVTNAPAFQDEFMRSYWVASIGGVNVFVDSNISANATATYGAMFSRNAIALDWRRAPRIEPERNASRRGIELNLSAVFAYGVWRPQFGVSIVSAGTAPTL